MPRGTAARCVLPVAIAVHAPLFLAGSYTTVSYQRDSTVTLVVFICMLVGTTLNAAINSWMVAEARSASVYVPLTVDALKLLTLWVGMNLFAVCYFIVASDTYTGAAATLALVQNASQVLLVLYLDRTSELDRPGQLHLAILVAYNAVVCVGDAVYNVNHKLPQYIKKDQGVSTLVAFTMLFAMATCSVITLR